MKYTSAATQRKDGYLPVTVLGDVGADLSSAVPPSVVSASESPVLDSGFKELRGVRVERPVCSYGEGLWGPECMSSTHQGTANKVLWVCAHVSGINVCTHISKSNSYSTDK